MSSASDTMTTMLEPSAPENTVDPAKKEPDKPPEQRDSVPASKTQSNPGLTQDDKPGSSAAAPGDVLNGSSSGPPAGFSGPAYDGPPPPTVPAHELRDFTVEELCQYDGTGPDKRILMAISGKVYDVSSSQAFYGPGKPLALQD